MSEAGITSELIKAEPPSFPHLTPCAPTPVLARHSPVLTQSIGLGTHRRQTCTPNFDPPGRPLTHDAAPGGVNTNTRLSDATCRVEHRSRSLPTKSVKVRPSKCSSPGTASEDKICHCGRAKDGRLEAIRDRHGLLILLTAAGAGALAGGGRETMLDSGHGLVGYPCRFVATQFPATWKRGWIQDFLSTGIELFWGTSNLFLATSVPTPIATLSRESRESPRPVGTKELLEDIHQYRPSPCAMHRPPKVSTLRATNSVFKLTGWRESPPVPGTVRPSHAGARCPSSRQIRGSAPSPCVRGPRSPWLPT